MYFYTALVFYVHLADSVPMAGAHLAESFFLACAHQAHSIPLTGVVQPLHRSQARVVVGTT
jgi:hypothetical protein